MSDRAIFEIGLLARVTWNLHSLNNEGTVGNVVEPRTVVLADGSKVDAVSGEMLKHVHTENVWLILDKEKLCPACQRLQPQRADMREYRATFSRNNIEAMTKAIRNCVLCDAHGFLMQAPAIARKSTVEFGWAVGLPDRVHRLAHAHARHAVGERGQSVTGSEGDEEVRAQMVYGGGGGEGTQAQNRDEEVRAQMVYHRPTRSGVYALVSLFQPWRLGLNEVDYSYALTSDDRTSRYQVVITAYRNMLRRAEGAMTSTRLPHVEALEGVIVYSLNRSPVPLVSPLRDNFVDEVENIVRADADLTVQRFSSVGEVSAILECLKEMKPFAVR